MGNLFEKIRSDAVWAEFGMEKRSGEAEDGKFLRHLDAYLSEKRYLAAADRLERGEALPCPSLKLISKGQSTKKRKVFLFPEDENLLLKFIAWDLKRYDPLFAPNLYSFRRAKGAKDAWTRLVRIPHLKEKYVYKVDISDYFCSIEPTLLLPRLKEVLKNEPELYALLEKLLSEPCALVNGEKKEIQKGVLPGVPVSAFLANLFLAEMDWDFYRERVEYLRYSDDIIVFADTAQEREACADRIKARLGEKKLGINGEKEVYADPGEPWEFLGFAYTNGEVDVSEVALKKLQAKMRRKTRALKRWADRKKLDGVCGAKAFVKRMNAKLYENPIAGDLTWAKWYFPVITTDKSLKRIDAYAQDCIRYLATGKRTKKRFDFRYDAIRDLGYKSLVNAYYRFREGKFPYDE